MTRRFLAVTVFLAATVAFLVGLVVAGTMTPARAASATPPARRGAPPSAPTTPSRGIAPATIRAGDASFADIAERLNPAVVNIDATSRGDDRPRRRRPCCCPDEPGSVRAAAAARARRSAARRRHRLHHRRRRSTSSPTITSSTAPTGSWSRLTDGRTLRAERVGSDPGYRHRADQGRIAAAAAVCAARRLRHAARRRMGAGDRQSAGLRAHRHRRRRQLHRPQAVRLVARPLHPDRRRHQLRQQRRPADQRARRSDRHQRRHQLAGVEHRLRGADQPGERDPAAAPRERPRVARLHRRDAARRRSRICSARSSCRRPRARWCRTSRPGRPAPAPASAPTTSSSPSTASRSTATTRSFS